MEKRIQAAVLIPTYDELGTTIQRSLRNAALRMKEVQDISWALFIGVNGTDNEEEVRKVRRLVKMTSELADGIHVEVHHYTLPGKENAVNQLARAAFSHFSGWPDYIIGTDVKVYRVPGSFQELINQFNPNVLPKIIGASILPYPIDIYKQHFDLTPEQELFYRLLEIDKDPEVLKVFPKDHLRGCLYIMSGEWEDLIVGVPDDFTLTRRTRLQHGPQSIVVSDNIIGYIIPRQSFGDYFAVRYNRAMKHEIDLKEKYPELAGAKEAEMSPSEKQRRLQELQHINPQKYALFQTKKIMDSIVRTIIEQMRSVRNKSDRIKTTHRLLDEIKNNPDVKLSSISQEELSIDRIIEIACASPEVAAKVIICAYRYIILALATDEKSIAFGPREDRYRGMLPLDD